MSPDDLAALIPDRPAEQEMLYRVDPATTAADLAAATRSPRAPADAIVGTQTYLTQESVDRIADLYVPVLLAFSIFALLAAAFLIANIVSGIVLTSYRDIGVMKAVGYTPGQVRPSSSRRCWCRRCSASWSASSSGRSPASRSCTTPRLPSGCRRRSLSRRSWSRSLAVTALATRSWPPSGPPSGRAASASWRP